MYSAIEEAKKCINDVPVGCAIKKDGKIISTAHNERELQNDITAHAEILAIQRAQKILGTSRLTGCQLYVTLEPCPMCAGALNWAQVGRIVYGAADPRRGYSLFTPSLLHPRTEVSSGVLADECAALVQDFFKARR